MFAIVVTSDRRYQDGRSIFEDGLQPEVYPGLTYRPSEVTTMANGDKIRISVKGTALAAAREIVRRGLLASLIEERNGRSFWDVFPEDEHGGPAIAAVTAWYCEPAVCAEGVGFPPGTLLFYS